MRFHSKNRTTVLIGEIYWFYPFRQTTTILLTNMPTLVLGRLTLDMKSMTETL